MAKIGKKWVPEAFTANDKKYCRNQCTWYTRSGTHGVGDGKEVDVVKGRVPKAAEWKCVFLLPPSNARHFTRNCPLKKKRQGKQAQSLTLTVGTSEATKKDGEKDTLYLWGKKQQEMMQYYNNLDR